MVHVLSPAQGVSLEGSTSGRSEGPWQASDAGGECVSIVEGSPDVGEPQARAVSNGRA
jgi:hypothetical protein